MANSIAELHEYHHFKGKSFYQITVISATTNATISIDRLNMAISYKNLMFQIRAAIKDSALGVDIQALVNVFRFQDVSASIHLQNAIILP